MYFIVELTKTAANAMVA